MNPAGREHIGAFLLAVLGLAAAALALVLGCAGSMILFRWFLQALN